MSKALESFFDSSFFRQLSKGNEKIYLVLLSLYISTFLLPRIYWTKSVAGTMGYVRIAVMSLVIWGAALYLFAFAADWKNLWKRTGALLLLAAVVFGSAGIFSRFMTFRAYNVVMDAYFCLFACGKKFRNMVKCGFGTVTGMLLVSGIGELAGITAERPKPERAVAGLSLGTIYPNTWAYLVFLAAMLLWSLMLRRPGKTGHRTESTAEGEAENSAGQSAEPAIQPSAARTIALTFAAFWGLAAVILVISTSRTIAALCVLFPVAGILALLQTKRQASVPVTGQEAEEETIQGRQDPSGLNADKLTPGVLTPGAWLWILLPFLCFGFTMLLCLRMDWVHDTFYYTFFHTMAMRFVEGGNILRMNGIPLIGHGFELDPTRASLYAEEMEYIVDNTYVSYIILRGALWMALCLCWLAAAHAKALKNGDWPLLAVSAAILVFGLMERPGLDLWYNLVLLYPLARYSQ